MTTIQEKTPTYEQVCAMRAEADNAESILNRIDIKVLNAENNLRYLESELIVAKRTDDLRLIDLRAERHAAQVQRDAIYKQWNDQLEEQAHLWTIYCEALDAYMAAEAQEELLQYELNRCDECHCHASECPSGGCHEDVYIDRERW